MSIVQEAARVGASRVPSHVPRDLIYPYDLGRISGPTDDPFSIIETLRSKGPVLYTPTHFSNEAGAWVLTGAKDIREVLQNPEVFSSKGVSGFSRLLGETWDMIPLELDPPKHTQFRALLNPFFSPQRVAGLQEGVRRTCVELIEQVRAQGQCDFVEAFARPFPVRIFLQLMGWPRDDFDRFMKWESMLLTGETMPVRIEAAAAIRDYLLEVIADRRRHPSDDLTSVVVGGKVDGRSLEDGEILGILYLLFVGGLDTVASSLGFYFRHLARHPEHQARLRADKSLIPTAIEELLRLYSVVMVSRFATRDVKLAGVEIKQGDCLAIYSSFASQDPEEFANPQTADLDRTPNRHIAFAFGPHRCIGSHLARRELVIAIEEWMQRVPEFRIQADSEVRMHGGVVFGVDALPLIWDPVRNAL